ncbi:copper resistance protein CopC [Mycolicibacterium duvalii]|uniref:Copper resistance protein C n=1 Tax=Mycolicibacterium duvalii TaxID=39688 RepID=A0A7I7K6G1_9MYCO|nr:copper resistance CopC family protein [Mycolicibacterium duvalii]MCV7369789.1 copper resistance protein CopC [Mycolicibacterium duvalii]PEG35042.1 copper resistance protein CopC [Mycolicibacterium duvalii]BBX19685.1 copper resistance protein C [Mycolicibacterium duvalii]
MSTVAAPRFLLAALAAAVLLVTAGATAGPAWAHAALVGTDPAADAEVARPPARVSATFSETMQPQFAAMTVVGPDGAQWGDGEPRVDDTVISVGIRAGAPAGEYTVNYRATSADGHVVNGSWSFRANADAPGSATAAPPPPDAPPVDDASGDGLPVWPFLAAGAVVITLGAAWAVRRQR